MDCISIAVKKYMPLLAIALLLTVAASSCSESNVPCEQVKIPVKLTIRHNLEWTDTLFYPNGYQARGGIEQPPCRVRYVIRAYPKGANGGQSHLFEFFSNDLTLSTFTTTLKLPMGDWDLYAWQDLVTEGEEPYYNVNDFREISYIKPYRGDTDHRDCFRGMVNVTVPPQALSGQDVEGILDLERPTGKYVFIATDYNEFVSELGSQNPAGYSITGIYATFMPSVFNNLENRVIDSARGMRYDATIVPLGNGRAAIAMDYVLMNSRDSGVQIQLALRNNATGELHAITDVITVPLHRARITYVEGDFLTAKSSSGINIDVGFSGDINIKI